MTSFIRIPVSIRDHQRTKLALTGGHDHSQLLACEHEPLLAAQLRQLHVPVPSFLLAKNAPEISEINTHAFRAQAFLGQRRDEGLSDIFVDSVNWNILERRKQVFVNCECHAVPSTSSYYVVHIVEPELSTVCKGDDGRPGFKGPAGAIKMLLRVDSLLRQICRA